MGDRLSTESPRIAIIVPQVPRVGWLTNIFPRLLQIVMLPGITRDAHNCEKGRIGVRNVGSTVACANSVQDHGWTLLTNLFQQVN